MGFNKDTYFWMMDFEEKLALLKFAGAVFFLDFANQDIKPDEWQNLCISVSVYHNQIKIVMNGEILFDEKEVDLSNKKVLSDKLWLGGSGGSKPWFTNRRLEGTITDMHLWNESLSFDFLKSITKTGTIITAPVPDLFSWSTFEMESNISCVEYIMKDELFHEKSQTNILIEYLADFNSANYLCQAFGGKLLVPKTDQELNELSSLIHQSENCFYAFLGLKKFNQTMAIDLNGKIASFVKWGRKSTKWQKLSAMHRAH